MTGTYRREDIFASKKYRASPKTHRKAKSKREPISPAEAARRQRQREQSQRGNWRAAGLPPPIGHNAPPVGIPRVIPWLEWVKLRGFSVSTGERLARAGKVKVTYLSPRRKGVREDHDREYLDSCTRGGE
jgi:hypothetical protein